ncbi:MAG: signal peptidase I [Akkermansiaceae bacterium]|jgi:signal peptidase I|nr:signal peptidase I [Akkermansiaceae bacterium]
MFDFLKPKWKRQAQDLLKGSKKFVHYKRDLLKEDRVAEIESRRQDLADAIKAGNEGAAAEASKQLQATCEKALPRAVPQSWWEENLEVLFVAMVIALGLRTYVVQPFRIPTGSMQPTLNGIVIRNDGQEAPWLGGRAWDFLFHGRTYREIIAENDKKVVGIRDRTKFLFTRTEVMFDDGSSVKIAAAEGETIALFGISRTRTPQGQVLVTGNSYKKGDVILKGSITSGDLVLVDRISYHFRSPRRGEVFVFDTRGIATNGDVGARMRGQTGGSHYIKRLCGVPGDALSIDEPNLLNHGKIVQEPGIRRVAAREGIYAVDYDGRPRRGYHVVGSMAKNAYREATLTEPGEVFELKIDKRQGMNQYAALGDNTDNSLDSRYWGPVHEFNLVGPGWFSLWPFGSGHWGRID